MNGELLGGFEDVHPVPSRSTRGGKRDIVVGDFHATWDGKVSLCGRPIRSTTQPWHQKPMTRNRCLMCIEEGAPTDHAATGR